MGFTSSMDLPADYEEAKRFFEGRRKKKLNYRNIGNNTQVCELVGSDDPCYSIKLRQTHIITYYPDGRVELDNYDSGVTNDRRCNAGKPTIHGITGMASGKVNRVLEQRRWVVRNAHHDLPYGLPADMALTLNPDGSVYKLENIEEYLWVPRVEDQKQRKALLRWARGTVKPVVESMQALEAFPNGVPSWVINAADLEELRERVDEAATDIQVGEEVGDFIRRNLQFNTAWYYNPDAAQFFEDTLAAMTPSAVLNRWRCDELWDKITVRTIDLPKYLK